MADTRNENRMDRRGLLCEDIQELSKREMEDVTGGAAWTRQYYFATGGEPAYTTGCEDPVHLIRS